MDNFGSFNLPLPRREPSCITYLLTLSMMLSTVALAYQGFGVPGIPVVFTILAVIGSFEPMYGYPRRILITIVVGWVAVIAGLFFLVREIHNRRENYNGWDLLLGRCCC